MLDTGTKKDDALVLLPLFGVGQLSFEALDHLVDGTMFSPTVHCFPCRQSRL
jgi:hypothetical protein